MSLHAISSASLSHLFVSSTESEPLEDILMTLCQQTDEVALRYMGDLKRGGLDFKNVENELNNLKDDLPIAQQGLLLCRLGQLLFELSNDYRKTVQALLILSSKLVKKRESFCDALHLIDESLPTGLRNTWHGLLYIYSNLRERSELLQELKAEIESGNSYQWIYHLVLITTAKLPEISKMEFQLQYCFENAPHECIENFWKSPLTENILIECFQRRVNSDAPLQTKNLNADLEAEKFFFQRLKTAQPNLSSLLKVFVLNRFVWCFQKNERENLEVAFCNFQLFEEMDCSLLYYKKLAEFYMSLTIEQGKQVAPYFPSLNRNVMVFSFLQQFVAERRQLSYSELKEKLRWYQLKKGGEAYPFKQLLFQWASVAMQNAHFEPFNALLEDEEFFGWESEVNFLDLAKLRNQAHLIKYNPDSLVALFNKMGPIAFAKDKCKVEALRIVTKCFFKNKQITVKGWADLMQMALDQCAAVLKPADPCSQEWHDYFSVLASGLTMVPREKEEIAEMRSMMQKGVFCRYWRPFFEQLERLVKCGFFTEKTLLAFRNKLLSKLENDLELACNQHRCDPYSRLVIFDAYTSLFEENFTSLLTMIPKFS